MSTFNPIKRFSAIVLSMSLAAPVQSWARATDVTPVPVETATEGAPFVYQEFDTPQGRAFTVIAAYPEAVERETILRLAGNNPKGLTLAVNGADDPGFKAAMESGNLDWINTYKMGSIEQSAPVRAETDPTRTQKIVAKFKEMGANVKANPVGLIAAFGYAGVVSTGGVYVQTASVTTTLGTIVPVGLLAAFSATQSTQYGKIVAGGGQKAVNVIDMVASAFGTKLNGASKQIVRAGGVFATTMASGWATAGFIMSMGHQDFTMMSLTTMSIATNIAIWDGTVGRLVHQHKIDHKWEPYYFVVALAVSTAGELGALLHAPHAESIMSVMAMTGLGYFVAGESIENAIGRAKKFVTAKVDTAKGRIVAGVNNVNLKTRAAAARTISAASSTCDTMLSGAGRAIGLPAAQSMYARTKARVTSRQANVGDN